MGNGAHLFAPFSWELLNVGWFWPANLPTILLTIGGLAVGAFLWRTRPGVSIELALRPSPRLAAGTALMLLYFLAPGLLVDGPETADSHAVKTLRQIERRPGSDVAFDRALFIRTGDTGRIRTFAGEEINIEGPMPQSSGTISAKARFIDPTTVELLQVRTHWPWGRDIASVVGLLLVGWIWLSALFDSTPSRRET